MTRPQPNLKDPEYLSYAHLFNAITRAPLPNGRHMLFSQRQALADHLWDLGVRLATDLGAPAAEAEPDGTASSCRPAPSGGAS